MPLYMRKDEHGYRFVRPIPKDLIAQIGKSNFTKRLGHDYKKAKIACAEWTVRTDRKLEKARSSHVENSSLESFLAQAPSTRYKSLRYTEELPGQIASLWLHSLHADAHARAEGLDQDEFENIDANVKSMLPLIGRALGSGQVSQFHPAVNQLLVFRGYLLDENAPWQKLTYEVLKHFQAGYKILAARQEGEHLGPPDFSTLPPPLPAAWEALERSPSKQVVRLSDVTSIYQEHLQTSGAKTQTTYLSIWQRFVDYANDKALHSVKSADVFNFLKSRLHASDKPWSYRYTSGRVRRVLSDAFALARTQNLTDTNPVTDLEVLPKISAKVEESRRKPRYPYKAHHLNTLFKSEWYNPEAKSWKGKMKEDLGARYWIPLLCMFHGFRVREATQLKIHDVDLAQNLIKIQVTKLKTEAESEIGPERTLKNKSTHRDVPIHPTLLELGFIDFVRAINLKYVDGPLFLSALPEKGGRSPKWGRAYEQPFLRFMRDTLELGNGYGNHSFRHSLEDRIRAANVEQPWPAGLAHAYTGRAQVRVQDTQAIRQEGSEKNYGEGYAPDDIRRYARRIAYPDVQLPLPFKEWLGGREIVSKRLLVLIQQIDA